MPRDPSWDEIYNNFKKQECFPDCYYAWLNKHGFDDSKPRSSQMETRFEAFAWMGDVSADTLAGTPNKVRFFANHVGCTANKNCRSPEQQRLSARSLALRPILINHGKGEWKGNAVVGWTADSEYDFNEKAGKHGVAGWGFVSDKELWEKVRKHEAPFSKGKVSIGEISRKSIVRAGGKDVIGGIIWELSFLTDDVLPGDSAGYVETIEAWSPVIEQKWEMKLSEQEKTDKSVVVVDPLAGVGKKFREAVWSAAFINDLPDSAFAKIDSGGTKDSEGKTTPRSLRHYPHHGTDGEIDLPHLRNDHARASQQGDESAQRHLDEHKKSMKIGQFAESQESKDAWARLEEESLQWAIVEEQLYNQEMRLARLEPMVTAKAEELVSAIVERHDLGKILNIFGPRFVKMEATQDEQAERLKQLEACAGSMKSGSAAAGSRLSESEAQSFRAKFDGIFARSVHTEHLPPHVSRQYLEDAILSDRKQTKSQIETIR